MKRKLLLGFLLVFVLVLVNLAFLNNLRNLPYANYYILLLAINIDLLALIVITAIVLRKIIKVYLGKHPNVLRRKLANILFLYLFVPLLILNVASIFVVIHSTKEYLSSKTRALSSSAERVYRSLYTSELKKVDMYKSVLKALLEAGLVNEVRKIEDVESVIPVSSCEFEVSEGELSYIFCLKAGDNFYRVVVSKELSLIRDISEFGELAFDVRAFVKTRDIITGIFVFFIVFITVLTLLATVWLSMLVARHISGPIERLSEKAIAIADGNLDVDIEAERTGDEIERLYKAFIKMKENLRESYEKLKLERDMLEKLLNALPVGVMFLSKDGTLKVNRALEILLGKPKDADELVNKAQENKNLRLVRIEGKEGELYLVEDVSPIVIAERFKTWQEAVKRIAHEIKNPLTPIKLNLERLQRYTETGRLEKDKLVEITRIILKEIDRISELINQFKHLTPERKPHKEKISLRSLIEEVIKLYSSAGIKVEVEGDKELLADPSLLKEMFYNLINNSIEWGAQEIKISINEDRFDYKDDGRGLSAQELTSVFIPYYSNNPKGMGIGMAVVKKIVEDHGWEIKALPSKVGAHFVIDFRSRN